MTELIGFGQCSKYYLYILCTVIIKAVKHVIYGFSDIDQRNKEDFQVIKPIPLFCQHNLLQNLIKYLGHILGGFIFIKIIEKKNISNKKSVGNTNKDIDNDQFTPKYKLIYRNMGEVKFNKIEIIIIGSIICIYNELRKLLYLMNFYFIDFWTVNVLFIIYFMNKYFKIDFYNYQKCSLFFIVFTATILLIVNTVIPQHRVDNKNEWNLYEETLGNAALSIPFLLSFFLSYFISYARVKIKLLTQIKFISYYTIIIFIGISGIILTLIEILFSECFKCTKNKAFETLCFVTDSKNVKYHDEIKTFFVNFGDLSTGEVFINIVLILFFPILCFFEILCELLIIYYLNPIYILIRDNIYNFCLRIIFVSLRINKDFSDYMTPRFFILEFAEIFSLLGFFVYLQLIELKFCGLDQDLNKNIIDRGKKEIITPLKIINIDDSEDCPDDVTSIKNIDGDVSYIE